MTKIKAVIIEDELPAARLLDKQLRELRPEWEVTVLPGTIEDSVKCKGGETMRVKVRSV